MADTCTLHLCSRVPIVWPLQQFYCVFWMILCKWSWVTVWLPFSFPLEPRRFPKLLSMFYGRMSCTCTMIVLRENLTPFWTKVSHSLCISCVVITRFSPNYYTFISLFPSKERRKYVLINTQRWGEPENVPHRCRGHLHICRFSCGRAPYQLLHVINLNANPIQHSTATTFTLRPLMEWKIPPSSFISRIIKNVSQCQCLAGWFWCECFCFIFFIK